MKFRSIRMIIVCIFLNLIFITACAKERTEERINVHVAHEKLVEEFLKTDNIFDRNEIVITEIGVVEETSTLHVGLLV